MDDTASLLSEDAPARADRERLTSGLGAGELLLLARIDPRVDRLLPAVIVSG